MLQLTAVLVAPAIGAVLYVVLHRRPGTMRVIDTIVFVALPLLIAWQVLPHVWLERQFGPLLAVGAGIGLLYLLERISETLARHTDNATIVLAVLAMVLHALLEGGAVLVGPSSVPFTSALVLHRVAVGLLVWWLLEPRHGVRGALAGVAAIIVATVIGALAGTELLPDEHAALEMYQAFISGSLLHVVLHQGRRDHRHGPGHAHG
ncbi:hypothetical protein [Candidatus Palauibacter sp.]|uniref:hypothetical protein n=1 Tax=Candidatus Palauibacter sp. TaxID=3101350 RepID=UPI003B022CBA